MHRVASIMTLTTHCWVSMGSRKVSASKRPRARVCTFQTTEWVPRTRTCLYAGRYDSEMTDEIHTSYWPAILVYFVANIKMVATQRRVSMGSRKVSASIGSRVARKAPSSKSLRVSDHTDSTEDSRHVFMLDDVISLWKMKYMHLIDQRSSSTS